MLKKIGFSFLFIILFLQAFIYGQSQAILPPIKTEEYKLKNGLRVFLHQDKSVPIVAVNIWYHVGSKNEVVGKTGFAHLFEHLMFEGSKNVPFGYDAPLRDTGGENNASTSPDRTNYYVTLPSNFLELALYLESDRMSGLLDAMNQEKLDNQRDVVKNERRQNYENPPYGTAFEKISELMYPKEHPYHWLTIGSLTDLTAASLDDVKGFFRQYYVPNNASLVVAGDFDSKQAKAWINKYFGPIAKGAEIKRPNNPLPKLDKETRVTVEDTVPLPRLYISWHTVPQGHPDEAPLDFLASILSSGRGSRLQSNLVYDKLLVQNISASHPTREIAGMFQITATARPQKTLDEIEKEINAEIEKLKKNPPTQEEINRVLNVREASAIFGLQTVLAKADRINSYATFYGNPDYFQTDLARYQKVTAADVLRVANQYLTPNRLVMSYVPGKSAVKKDANADKPTSAEGKQKHKDKEDFSKLPKPGPDPKLSLPTPQKRKLSNGLEVWLVRQSELPIVSMNMVFKTGATFEPEGKEGVGQFTSGLLTSGTKTRSALDIFNQLQAIGSGVGASSGWDFISVGVSTLTKNLDKALEIYSDVIVNPTFPESEMENIRRRALVGFAQLKANPNAVANTVYNKLLYGKHPYGKSLAGNEESVKSLKRQDLIDFYTAHYLPNNAVLIVTGDVDEKNLLPKLEKSFADWKPGEVKSQSVSKVSGFSETGIYLVDKPNAAQSVVSIVQNGIERDNPDYYSLMVLNTILGGEFTSRVNANLRESKGFTYGAGTFFDVRRGAGPFVASADFQTEVTKEAISEFMKELREIRGTKPVTANELREGKQTIIRRFPSGFETSGQISGKLASIVMFNLPDSYFNDYISKIQAVTLEDVNKVAAKYIDPSKMAIVVVGDKKTVEPKLKELGYPITILDADGNKVN